ncbi:DUF523 domain-containing protein [Curvivirga aplysinae]|uniref:DUF523 domain-containing protein n=1 Tax=Curvivirga aplysinae TaxID=2529852 RepID=UPI0012BD3A35|nr:DUF523 domain-containing protein [Curvivirga aplysinae]MTI08417.1 DUF523 domain-containing protein [Curvivirga aplysinae]
MQNQDKILISACLLGQPVRYDGNGKLLSHELIHFLKSEDRLIPICPEVMAGFDTPRPRAEIQDTKSGEDVLLGTGRILDDIKEDVTDLFISGAEIALEIAQEHNCKYALLTEKSPSCGSTFIYDGSFSGTTHKGMGVASALLIQAGIQVFSSDNVEELAAILNINLES